MNQSINSPRPKLLKARIAHWRIFSVAMVVLIFLSSSQLRSDAPTLMVVQWLGYSLVFSGVAIRIYSSLYIGGRKNKLLITDGPFSVVRNPLYVGSFIALVGIGLESGSITVLALLAMAFGLYYPFVIQREQEYLEHKFGHEYRQYKLFTPAFIPKFCLWKSPGELNCKPYFVLRTITDSAMFFLPLPLFDLLRMLHATGQLPVLWVLR